MEVCPNCGSEPEKGEIFELLDCEECGTLYCHKCEDEDGLCPVCHGEGIYDEEFDDKDIDDDDIDLSDIEDFAEFDDAEEDDDYMEDWRKEYDLY